MAQQQAPKHLPSRERGNSPPLVKFLNLGNGVKRRRKGQFRETSAGMNIITLFKDKLLNFPKGERLYFLQTFFSGKKLDLYLK